MRELRNVIERAVVVAESEVITEADLSDEDGVGRHRVVGARAGNGHRDGEVDAGFGNPHSPGHVRVYVEPGEIDARTLLQDRDEQREAPTVESLCTAARDRRPRNCTRG